jgi:hypothetical protein
MSGSVGDVGKVQNPHRCRLMPTSMERQVAICLQYQAGSRDGNAAIGIQGLLKECHEA